MDALPPREFQPVWLGRRDYESTHDLQRALVDRRAAKEIPDTLLMVEHAPVITVGRGAKEGHILASPELLASRGVRVIETERGGDVTYHGPGQLVVYPIFDLAPGRCDVRKYVRDLIRVMVSLCADHGIGAGGRDAAIGAWVDLASVGAWPGEEHAGRPAKIGAIGVKISRWVTMHGFALNATTRLADFDLIVPCGIREHPVTSLEALGVADVPSVESLARRAVAHFETVFNLRARDLTLAPP